MKKLLLLIMFCQISLVSLANNVDGTPTTDQEIQQLIQSVEDSGCIFYRNSKAHSAERGAKHLRLKLKRGAKYAKTAEDFIKNLASNSSWSREPYEIECKKDEKSVMRDWLHKQLEVIRSQSNE